MGPALDQFDQAGDNPEPWQCLPDFEKTADVAAAIAAIAEHCDANGQKGCAQYCRQRLDDIAPPVKPGGLPPAELAKYLREHPGVSAVVAMRTEATTPEQAMQSWVICARRVGDRS